MKYKLLIPLIYVVSILILLFCVSIFNKASDEDRQWRNHMKQLFAQEQLLKEGDTLVEQGLYEEASEKYDLALSKEFISKDQDKRGPIVRKIRLSRISGQYGEGLREFGSAPQSLRLDEELKLELQALQKAAETISVQSIYEYITHLKHKYENSLPPKTYSNYSSIPIANILRLYDTIGDHEAGIGFIDECLAYFKKIDVEKYGEYRPGKADKEYLKIREAFEQDKAEGTKGRATKALIQSDYFLW